MDSLDEELHAQGPRSLLPAVSRTKGGGVELFEFAQASLRCHALGLLEFAMRVVVLQARGVQDCVHGAAPIATEGILGAALDPDGGNGQPAMRAAHRHRNSANC